MPEKGLCSTCNGADNKGNTNVVYGKCHLPHLNNTFLSLVYKPGGVVEVNPALTGLSAANADALYHLVGLHKNPTTSSRLMALSLEKALNPDGQARYQSHSIYRWLDNVRENAFVQRFQSGIPDRKKTED